MVRRVSLHPSAAWPAVRCFAYARGTAVQKPGGQGGGAPNNAATSAAFRPMQTTSVGGLRPPGAFRSPALQRGRRINVPFCHAKWDTLEKPVDSEAPNAASIGMAARIGRPKSPAGFACRGYLILRPVGATAPPCGARGSLRGGRSPPRIIFTSYISLYPRPRSPGRRSW